MRTDTGEQAMLRGFNYPLTPKGKSTLNPPPPWYYSADFLNVEFWAAPSAVAALLPPGLDPDTSANGRSNALFYDWQFSGDDEEYLDPARYQYREFFILVDALTRVSRSRIAPTSSSTTMPRLLAVGLRAIPSAWVRCTRPDITPLQGRQAPLSRREQSLLGP